MVGLGLNVRQKAALVEIKRTVTITNSDYQRATGASRPTAIRDLSDLVAKGVLVRRGATKGAYYHYNAG